MQPSKWEVVILKPTPVFLSFLASQVGEELLPDFEALQTDQTAYVIPKYEDEEATLNEIEKHFTAMFHHEISRWLGEDAYNEIETSFLDFLCCFKFELHNQIVLMESDFSEGKQLLRLKPKSLLMKWLKSTVEDDTELREILEDVNLAQLGENGTVVIKNFSDTDDIKPFIEKHYMPVYETEMKRMCDESNFWPKVSDFDEFKKYFNVHVHTQLIHLYQ